MNKIHPKIFYSESYNFSFFNLNKFHPFDGCKYQKIWEILKNNPDTQTYLCNLEESDLRDINSKILKVHNYEYINKLNDPDFVASILELPYFPFRSNLLNALNCFGLFSLQSAVLEPMKWATAGTIKAAHEALNCRIAVNLSGGYHHASKNNGEGFCIYSDIAIAIEDLRKTGTLEQEDSVLIIDLDAHQGNGLERIFLKDESVYMFDMYNKDIYPQDKKALNKLNLHKVPLTFATDGQTYLNMLKKQLPDFLDKIEAHPPKIAFYNAGTDVYRHDPLGGLKLNMDEVLERDIFVFESLTKRKISWVMVLSGGYTANSYTLVTNSLKQIKIIAEQNSY